MVRVAESESESHDPCADRGSSRDYVRELDIYPTREAEAQLAFSFTNREGDAGAGEDAFVVQVGEPRWHHFVDAGVTIGVREIDSDFCQVVVAWCAPEDQFVKREAREVCDVRFRINFEEDGSIVVNTEPWAALLDTFEVRNALIGARAIEEMAPIWDEYCDEGYFGPDRVRDFLAHRLFDRPAPG